MLFHWLGWHGKSGKSLTGYDSRDPNVIKRQLQAMLAFGGPASGVVALSYGPTVDPFIHQAVLSMASQCNALNVPFMLCMDPWTVKNAADKNQAMIQALTSPDFKFLLQMDCYVQGRPVLDFATGCDKATVAAAVPGIQYWMSGTDYDWVKIPEVQNKTSFPCVYVEFNDGTGPDRNKSVWDQTQPARIVPSLAGSTFFKRNLTTPVASFPYVQVATWNDVAEGTDIEKFAAIVSGRIY